MTYEISEDDYIAHYGVRRRSGRYPWGSGEDPHQRATSFQQMRDDLRKQGLSDTEIAKGFGMTTTQLRATIAIAKNETKQADIAMAQRLKEKGLSNVAIGERMGGLNESSVRALLAPGVKDRADILNSTADMLRDRVGESRFIDIGKGVENHLGISNTKLATAVSMLESEGYTVHTVKVPQKGTGLETTFKVLAPPGTEWKDVRQNIDKIEGFKDFSQDNGRTWNEVQPPISVDPSRLQVKWGNEGGKEADGVIYVRPGAKDLSLGSSSYAQVRIKVGDNHYLKGMAVLKDDLPAGVDLQFNTNKDKKANKLDALKPIKDDPENPFGTVFRQLTDANGKNTSAMNIVNDETDWDNWSRNLASQMLSKQKPTLIKERLDSTYENKKKQLDEINALTNPVVKKKLLQSYADDMDSSATHLKAAALPRQKTHVILPINSLKDNEIYAPNYKDGEKVVLVRYPHGGTFEIPELTVNNRNPQGKKTIDRSTAVVGINAKVAERLSGADFDGDTVVVIPNNDKRITTSPPLAGLKGFDPQSAYPGYEGMKVMNDTQTQMGKISNLITDMTIANASKDELARAVRHSMVVIDAEKHKLNYKQSEVDNGIKQLKTKYQGGPNKGATTLIARIGADVRVEDFKPRPAKDGGPIDKDTGRLVFVPSGKTYNKRVVGKDGEVTWVQVPSTRKVKRGDLPENRDAHNLSSGTEVEKLYADYSNRVRSLADQARLSYVNTPSMRYSPSAKETYSKEVSSLNAKLNEALKNSPLERKAQVLAGSIERMKRESNPDMDAEELRKVRNQALKTARARINAEKKIIDITPSEWEAIQAGAISGSKLSDILDNADIEKVKQLATPKQTKKMTSAKTARAKNLYAAGYTQAEIAQALGVSLSTLKDALA